LLRSAKRGPAGGELTGISATMQDAAIAGISRIGSDSSQSKPKLNHSAELVFGAALRNK
jgi:hypothetical protein